MNGNYKWQKRALSALCIFLSLVLLVMIFATVYVHSLLNLMGRVDPDEDYTLSPEDMATATEAIDPDYTGPVVDPSDVTISTLPQDQLPDDHGSQIVNILLVGQDRKEGEPRQRSDSMILCTFNMAKKTITMTSFMRDTYVYIPGYGKNKLNAAYQFGGFTLLNETLAVNFGIRVDSNVEVDFGNFKNIIDCLGGVQIELTEGEANYINTKLKEDRVSAGVQILDGEEALWYARNRSTKTLTGTNNDFGRTERQRRLLGALLEAYKNQSIDVMLSMVYEILPMVTTNMTNQEILNYVVDLFPLLAQAQIQTVRVPADGMYYDEKQIGNIGDVLVPDLEAIRESLKEIFSTE